MKKLKKHLFKCENHAGLLLLMANSSLPLQKNMEGLSYATKALNIDPHNAEAMHIKGAILSLMGDKEGSLELLEKSVKSEPTNTNYKLNYCSTLESFGEYSAAIEVCTDLINNHDTNPIAYFIRSRAYEALGRSEKANKDLEMYNKIKRK